MKNIGMLILLSITLIGCGLKKPLTLEEHEEKTRPHALKK